MLDFISLSWSIHGAILVQCLLMLHKLFCNKYVLTSVLHFNKDRLMFLFDYILTLHDRCLFEK